MTLAPSDRSVLEEGDLGVVGRMPWSSNGTFLVTAELGGQRRLAVYKPVAGERPLWDFPPGLDRREVAAYELARALGWPVVPLTVARAAGPLGPGSVQLYVEADPDQHYFSLVEDERHHPALRRLCLFDLLANSADRKAGHCLLDTEGGVWGIDNGLCFHEELKLRTVIWDFAGQPVDADLVGAVAALVEGGLPDRLARLLDEGERRALDARARAVLARPTFPADPTGRRFPWPLV